MADVPRRSRPVTTWRSDEIAALNIHVVTFDTRADLQDARPGGRVGSISYHETMAPAPPRTTCCVQIAPASLPGVGCTGSTPDMACVGAPSCVSSLIAVPFCVAFVGHR